MIANIKKLLHNKDLLKAIAMFVISIFLFVAISTCMSVVSNAQQPGISININGAETENGRVEALDILFLMTVLALLPSILIMLTAFTRIVIVLSFVRNAIGLQQTPPNQVIIGLALFLTLFVMNPVIQEVKDVAYTPYVEGEITQSEAIRAAELPIKTFMLQQTSNKDLSLFITLADAQPPEDLSQISMLTAVPAFIISELKTAFTIGLLLYIPFIVIDMVVSSTLMSMGMIMLPPAMISMPFKIMLFVVVDGWSLLIKTLVIGFK